MNTEPPKLLDITTNSKPRPIFFVFLFTLYSIILFLIIFGFSWAAKGNLGVRAAVCAVFIVWGTGVASIISIIFARYRLKNPFIAIIMGLFFRMGVPLFVALTIALRTEKEFAIVVLPLFLVVYLLMLPVELVLSYK